MLRAQYVPTTAAPCLLEATSSWDQGLCVCGVAERAGERRKTREMDLSAHQPEKEAAKWPES